MNRLAQRLCRISITIILLASLSCSQDASQSTTNPDAGEPSDLWPDLPKTQTEAESLIANLTKRKISTKTPHDTEISAPFLLKKIQSHEPHQLIIGSESIATWLNDKLNQARLEKRDSYILVGSFHDNGEQIRAFRRLISPRGIKSLTAILVEQFRADGLWNGIAKSEQHGDSQDLSQYLESGDLEIFDNLRKSQSEQNYTGWRYSALDEIMDILLTARATGFPVYGCDMPQKLQARLDSLTIPARSRLREIHCLLSFKNNHKRSGPQTIAMFWGDAHTHPGGIQRFIHPDSLVISLHLIGGRPNSLSPEGKLSANVTINDPVILPLDEKILSYALLLPGKHLGGNVERSRFRENQASSEGQKAILKASSEVEGILSVAGQKITLNHQGTEILVEFGHVPLMFRAGEHIIIGSFDMTDVISSEISFDIHRKSTRVIHRLPPLDHHQ